MNPLVSIVIPYYNRIPKVLNSIDSVFKQSYENWELILIDDCSIENKTAIENVEIGPQNQSITHLTNKTNKGPGFSRNRGIDTSKGQYLLFLDSDDSIKPRFLERLVGKGAEDTLFVYCTSKWSDGQIYKNSNKIFEYALPTLLSENRPWHTSSILWNKKFIAYFDVSLRNWEDYLFEFKSALNMNRIGFVNQSLVCINNDSVNGLSILSESESGLLDRVKALDLMLVELESIVNPSIKKLDLRRLLVKKFIHFYLKLNNRRTYEFQSLLLKYIPKSKLVLLLIKKALSV